jgi:trk system potassium uptake protein TrkH
MAIMILPYLRIGGLQLFQTENSDRSEKVLPRAVEIMKAIAKIYFLMLFACAMLYMMFGMTLFDAVCYSLATVATGGFAAHDQSFGFFESPSLELIAIVFMILGVMPFVALVKAIHGDFRAPWHDPQVRGFITFLAVVIITVGVWYSLTNDVHLLTALRLSAFNVTSVVTTTGFASGDYSAWGPYAVGVFFLLMFVGGCTGSTAGGIKIYRMQMAALVTRGYLRNLISPNRVATLVYSGRRVPEDVPLAVIAFLGMYMATVGAVTLILTAMGLDFLTSISSAASAIGNVGPGLGEIVGPVGNYSSLPAGAKWVLAAAMLLGRLELFTVLVLFRPEFWR